MSEYVFRTDEPIDCCCKCPLCHYIAHIGYICNLLKENAGKIAYIGRLPNCPLKELPPQENPWHTGTPTEEGWYLCWVSFTKEIAPMVYKWKNGKFMLTDTWESDDDILMWQKIELYDVIKKKIK